MILFKSAHILGLEYNPVVAAFDSVSINSLVLNSWGPTVLHILYVSLILPTRFSSWSSLLTSWWYESGVLNKTDIQNVQSSESWEP